MSPDKLLIPRKMNLLFLDEEGNLTGHRLGQTKIRAVFNNMSAEATGLCREDVHGCSVGLCRI